MLLSSVLATAVSAETTLPGHSLEPKKDDTSRPSNVKPQGVPETKALPTEIQQFCANNAALMGDVRAMWQTARLQEIEIQVKNRISELEAKREQYADWIKKHEDALKKAQDDVVAIYAHMKPDAAAQQIAAMDDAIAAAILAKLSTRGASLILNEIEPGRAARLTNSMLGPNGSPLDKKKS
jgi:flagellar motility protein MotE (MotC chaperone)